MTPRRTEEIAGGLPRNYLQACLLLLIGKRSAHGYDLLEGLSPLGLRAVDPGGMYRTLRRLENDGLVLSWWERSSAGPARRTYELTTEGREWLHAWAGTLHETQRYLGNYLADYERVVSQPSGAPAREPEERA